MNVRLLLPCLFLSLLGDGLAQQKVQPKAAPLPEQPIQTVDPRAVWRHPLFGKQIWSIGDSHRVAYMQHLADITGAKYDHELNRHYCDGRDKYPGINDLVNQAYALIDEVYKKGIPVDYIFIEDGHWVFKGNIHERPSFICKDLYEYRDRSFANPVEARDYFKAHLQEIVGKYPPRANAVIRLTVDTIHQTLRFKLGSGKVTTAGVLTIIQEKSDGKRLTTHVEIPQGLTLAQAVTKINETEIHEEGFTWLNTRPHATLQHTVDYTFWGASGTGDEKRKLRVEGTPGLNLLAEKISIQESKSFWHTGFESKDVAEWKDPSKWEYKTNHADSYIWMKAMIEVLMTAMPEVKIVMFPFSGDLWDFKTFTFVDKDGKTVHLKNPDGSFNVDKLYAAKRHQDIDINCAKGMENVARYYHLQWIPVKDIWGVNWTNWHLFYPSNNVHCKKAGYDRVAETLAAHIH